MMHLRMAPTSLAFAKTVSHCARSALLVAAWMISTGAQSATSTAATPATAAAPSKPAVKASGGSLPVGAMPTAAIVATPSVPANYSATSATSTATAASPGAMSSFVTGSSQPAQPEPPLAPSPASPPSTQGSAPVFSAPSFTPAAKPDEEPAFEPGQLLVLWTSDEAASAGIATLQTRYQQRPRLRYTLGSLGFTVVMLALPSDREANALLGLLRAEQPDWVVDRNARSVPMQVAPAAASVMAAAPNPDAAGPRLYAQKMLGTLVMPALGSPALPPSLKVGVVDGAVDSALAQAGALNGSTVTQRSVLGPGDKPAATAHGNAVLQLLVGKAQPTGFAGSAPPVLLQWANAMRELGGKPSTNSLTLVLALDWLLSQQVVLVNMSLGGQGDAVLKSAINKLISKNITIVAAVGNNPAANAPPTYPAAYPGVLAVTAVDAAGKLYSQAHRASFVAIAAPGVELWVPSAPGAPDAGSYVSGTSYATALATATLAWQPNVFWSLAPAMQRTQICAKAVKLEAVAYSGCGLVQKPAAP